MSAASIAPDETLELRVKALRLPSLQAHYVSLAERAAAEGWSHVRYLAELVTLQANERADRRITRLLNEAKLRATRASRHSIGTATAHHCGAKSTSSGAGVPRWRDQYLPDRPPWHRQIARHGGHRALAHREAPRCQM